MYSMCTSLAVKHLSARQLILHGGDEMSARAIVGSHSGMQLLLLHEYYLQYECHFTGSIMPT